MGSSQSPPVPRDATTPPSQAQHIQVVSRETRSRHILMCDINCIPVWTSHPPAGFSLLQLFYYEAFVVIGLLCIVDVRLMAKETIRHCYGLKKATGDCVGERLPPLHSNSLRTCMFVVCFFLYSSSRPVLTEIPTTCRHIFASTASVLEVGMHYFYVSSHLDTTELLMVERGLCQDHPIAHKQCASLPLRLKGQLFPPCWTVIV